jgi:hypothetical protein
VTAADDRLALGHHREDSTRRWLEQRGFDVERFAPTDLRIDRLRDLPEKCLLRWVPDWIAAHRQKPYAFLFDSKTCMPGSRTPNMALEGDSYRVLTLVERTLRIPCVYVYDGGLVQRATYLEPGQLHPGVGPGRTPFYLVPLTQLRPIEELRAVLDQPLP